MQQMFEIDRRGCFHTCRRADQSASSHKCLDRATLGVQPLVMSHLLEHQRGLPSYNAAATAAASLPRSPGARYSTWRSIRSPSHTLHSANSTRYKRQGRSPRPAWEGARPSRSSAPVRRQHAPRRCSRRPRALRRYRAPPLARNRRVVLPTDFVRLLDPDDREIDRHESPNREHGLATRPLNSPGFWPRARPSPICCRWMRHYE